MGKKSEEALAVLDERCQWEIEPPALLLGRYSRATEASSKTVQESMPLSLPFKARQLWTLLVVRWQILEVLSRESTLLPDCRHIRCSEQTSTQIRLNPAPAFSPDQFGMVRCGASINSNPAFAAE